MGEIQRKDREIAEMNRQLNDIKKMKDYMEEKFLQASTPTGSRPSTPKKSDTSDEPTPVSKVTTAVWICTLDVLLPLQSPREDTLLIKNSELSFLAKTLRDDNDKIKKEKALLVSIHPLPIITHLAYLLLFCSKKSLTEHIRNWSQ